jgi:hypothetical protein
MTYLRYTPNVEHADPNEQKRINSRIIAWLKDGQ